MSFTKIPRTLLNTGVSDSSDATAITIDSSENIQFAGNIGVKVAPGADAASTRLKLDNPSGFVNMIEYGNVTWNQNTGHGLVAVNRGSDGYVQLQVTSNVDGADCISVRSSSTSGTGAGLKHNLMADGKAVHSGGLLVGTTTQPTGAELDGTGQAGGNVITIGDTTRTHPALLMRSSATNGNWLAWYSTSTGNLNTYNTDTNKTVIQQLPDGYFLLSNQPSFRATQPAVTNGGGNTVVYGSTGHNVGNHYNTSNGRFTCPVSGRYLFNFAILMNPASATSYSRILFAVNGSHSTQYGDTLSQYNSSSTSSYYAISASVILSLSTNDYVTLENHGTDDTYGTAYGSFCGQLLS